MWPYRRKAAGTVRSFRYERFGGIAHLPFPRSLVFVDRDRARALGHRAAGTLWDAPEIDGSAALDEPLTAPLEAHLQLTNRCATACQGCYTAATPGGLPDEWGLAEWKRALDELAARGVFHVALGGGESALLPWLGEVAAHARSAGLVPNLTTSGLLDEATLARLVGWAPLFGQINVSLDGVGDTYAAVRGAHLGDGFERADRAIVRLRRATRNVGINVVVTRESFPRLGELFAYARKRRLPEIELLRFKPSGRGARAYEALRCTDEQHRALLPTVLGLARTHRRRVRLDCSYTPMVVHHRPDARLLRWLCLYGCAGGDHLVGAKANGALTACSFAAPPEDGVTAERLGEYLTRPEAFGPFRRWREAAEPCRSCDYHALCRGGCRVVSAHTLGSAAAPDPECPRVKAYVSSHPAASDGTLVTPSGSTGPRRLPVVPGPPSPARPLP